MRAVLGAIAGLAVILAAGLACLDRCRKDDRSPGLDDLGVAYALGAAAVSVLMFWAAWLGHASPWPVLAPVLLVVFASPRRWIELGRAWRASIDRWTLVAALALALLMAVNVVLTRPSWPGVDGVAIWGFKARVALRGEIRASLVDPSRPWSHPEYPWLVPLIEAWFELVSGTRTESAGRVAQMGFHAATLLLVFGGLRRSVSLAWSIAGTLALGLLPSFVYWSTFEDADVAIGLAWAGSVIHLHRWLARGARSDALLAALLAVVAAWTKREGVVALALQGACFLAVAVHSRRIGPVLPIAIATLVVLTPWWLVISSCDVVPRDFLPVRIENAHLDRLPWIPILVGRELLSVTHWALLWPLVAVALPLRWKERPLLPRLYLVTSATAPLAILSGTYVFSTWPIWYEHVRNSFERLALQQAPVAVFFVTMTLAAPRSFMGAPGGRDVKKVILLVLGVLCGVYSLAQGAYLVLMLMGRAESNSTRLTASAGILCLALGVTLTLFKAALRAPGPPPGGAVGPSNKA